MFLRDSRFGTMTSRSLTVVQLCSVIFILLLRLAGEPCPNAVLHALWNSDPHYLDELISIWVQAITAGSDSPAALVQHTILSTDWWPYRTFILMTYYDVLKRLWNRRVQSRSLPESVCAALLTLSGWILCCICNCFFRGMLYSGSPFIGVKMSGFSWWECQAVCHTFPWRERQCPVRERRCLRSPGQISPNTETIFFLACSRSWRCCRARNCGRLSGNQKVEAGISVVWDLCVKRRSRSRLAIRSIFISTCCEHWGRCGWGCPLGATLLFRTIFRCTYLTI